MIYTFFVKSQVSKLVEKGAKNNAERAENTRKFDSRLQHENTINRSGETIHVELLLDTKRLHFAFLRVIEDDETVYLTMLIISLLDTS